MPTDTRALARAARSRAKRTGETYTQAREAVMVIHRLAEEHGWTHDEAEAYYDDPANQLLCATCGWTNSMVCPECNPGCGCSTGCSGWRHYEWGHEEDDDPEDGGCPECGAGGRGDPYGQCVCYPE